MSQTTTTELSLPTTALPDQLRPQPDRTSLNADVKAATSDSLSFDPEALAAKYRVEREKRVRATNQRGGLDQYEAVQQDGDQARLLKDPYLNEPLARDLIKEDCEVVVIGGGYGAQLAAVELIKHGINDFRMIEKGGDFGGTWYWNRYPGAQCDIESYVYMPLLEELDYVPTQKYAGGHELLDHARTIGNKFDLYSRTHFQTEVTSLHWQEELARWDVKTDRGDIISARFVIPVTGPLHRPKIPRLPGLSSFKGHTFHTTRWDWSYTGGDKNNPEAGLPGLKDKRVGVIGTGATAVQIVPHLGQAAKELYIFQRTPSSIDYRGNRTTDEEWVASLGEHWQSKRMDNFNIIVNGGAQDEDLVSDGWTDIIRKLTVGVQSREKDPKKAAEKRQLVDFEKMEQIRRRCDETVKDPATAESLKPYYNQFCKRPCFHDDYLPTFNRPNVKLIDTQGAGVEAVTGKGVIANGQEIELDCIIWATGFDIGGSWTARTGIEVYGRDGLSLNQKWEDGVSTMHGYTTHGFPNLFIISHTQAGLSPNFLHMIGFQAVHMCYIIGKCHERSIRTVEPTQEAEDAWVEHFLAVGRLRRLTRAECTPGYYNNEGQTSLKLQKKGSYGGGCLEFMKILREWRERDALDGLETVPW